MAYLVSRFVENITINPKEYLLDSNGNLIRFDTKEDAEMLLIKHGYTDTDINNNVFIEDEDEMVNRIDFEDNL